MKEELLEQLQYDLLELGVRPGGVLLVHSSLRALGHVPGGAETIIQGLRTAVGDDGTLLMPALTYETVTSNAPVFDVRQTPANVGIIPETFRQQPDVQRSVHPTHSVCGVGPLAAALLLPHMEDETLCGVHSPFHTLPAHNGQILMLGCGLRPNTSMHALEELVMPPYLFGSPIDYQLVLADGTMLEKRYVSHNFRGWVQRYDRVTDCLAAPGLRQGQVLAAEAFLLEATMLWTAVLPVLSRDPLYFVDAYAAAD
ncbi:MAG TPA: AAC(3) family N-acetyltransferase [Chloroflexota bacterium]|nr:AAC(3) family N-acetyltransferase [Chloroflexota bacterium]